MIREIKVTRSKKAPAPNGHHPKMSGLSNAWKELEKNRTKKD